ncbi:MAG: PQQ-dependent catabolism-associated CXXCW motif protein [Gammaproteobacteria bacterium]|nr:PQQ-dependent catabolism-associated CXXCW motif protein [Gammaproteobacteria bacterium]
MILPMRGVINTTRSTGAYFLLCTLLLFSMSVSAWESTKLFSSDGYRISNFRSPVPDTLSVGTTVTTAQVQTLLQGPDVVLIDVLPAPVKPKDRPPDLLWMPLGRYNIPGSIWLPNVGFGALSRELEYYFKMNLEKLSAGDKSRKIIIYCLANCWMSWNAAKRAVSFGYTRIYWYPDGTSGWEAAGLPLEKSDPIPQNNP